MCILLYTAVFLIVSIRVVKMTSPLFIVSPYYSNGYLGTPLSCAAYHGHDHIVKFLLSHHVSCVGSYAELKVFTKQQQHVDNSVQYSSKVMLHSLETFSSLHT